MMEIEKILSKYDLKKRDQNNKVNIEEIENKIGFPLPKDYLFYAFNYLENECFVGDEFVRLWNLDELLKFNSEYKIIENLKNTIAIGDNGSSEFIAIEFIENGKYRIVLSPFIDLNAKYHISIGCSFSDFFFQLENGKEWF